VGKREQESKSVIEFYGDGHRMSVEEAVDRFKTILEDFGDGYRGLDSWSFNIDIDIRKVGSDGEGA